MITSTVFENTEWFEDLSNKNTITSNEFVFFQKMILAENNYKIDNIEDKLTPVIENITLFDDNNTLKQRFYVEATILSSIPTFGYLMTQEHAAEEQAPVSANELLSNTTSNLLNNDLSKHSK